MPDNLPPPTDSGTIVVQGPNSATYLGWGLGSSNSGDTTGDTRPQEQAYAEDLAAFKGEVKPASLTPCVFQKPSEAPLGVINGHAAAARDRMMLSGAGYVEVIVLIYVLNGVVEKTLPMTSNQQNFTYVYYDALPVGAVVVGAIHSHPVAVGGSMPSGDDVQFFNNLRFKAEDFHWFSVSNNPVTYIFDTKTLLVHAYDRINIKGVNPGCTL